MKCADVKLQISSYLDNELSPHEEQKVYKHLAACSECFAYFNAARETNKLLETNLTPIDPPDEFKEDVLSRLPGYELAPIGRSDGSMAFSAEKGDVYESPSGFSFFGFFHRFRSFNVFKYSIGAALIALLFLVGGLSFYGQGYVSEMFARAGIFDGNYITGELQSGTDENDENDASGMNSSQKTGQSGGRSNGMSDDGESENQDKNQDNEDSSKDKNSEVDKSAASASDHEINSDKEVSESGSERSIMNSSKTVILRELAVSDKYNSVRPLWTDNNKIFYLSENRSPEKDNFVAWSINPDGSKKRIIGPNEYGISLKYSEAAWSPNGGKVAFVTDSNGYREVWYSDLHGEFTNITISAVGENISPEENDMWAYDPVWSSKGEIAFLTKRFNSGADLMAVDRQGNLRSITKGPAANSNHVWSPGGSMIAYFSSLKKEDGVQNRVYIADRNGSGQKSVTPNVPGSKMVPSWSPNGNKLVINVASQRSEAADYKGLWTVDLKKEEWNKIADVGGGNLARWSPDGGKIAFTDGDDGLHVLYLSDKEGQKENNLLQITPEDSDGGVSFIEWSPDSKLLLIEWKGPGTDKKGIWKASLP